MKVGDLVKPSQSCGGLLGGIRCETALVINVEISHTEQVEVDAFTYEDRDIYECTLMCKCGMFEEYDDVLEYFEVVNEDR